MDRDQIAKTLKPVKSLFTAEQVAEKVANETPLQKLFDNRTGPSVNGSPSIDYHVFSPEKNGKKHPVLIWLHGMAQGSCFREPVRGTDVANFASPAFQEKLGGSAYVVVPRANEDLGDYSTEIFYFTNSWLAGEGDLPGNPQIPELVGALRQFMAEEAEHIDLNRIYLAGFSAGGYMTWQTLLAMPEVFAAVAPICHARFIPSDAQLQSVSQIPMWLICGEKDFLYEPFVAPTIEKIKTTHNPEKLRITLLESVLNPDRTPAPSEHHSWVPVTFDMFYADGAVYDEKYPKGFIDWLVENPK